jgi:hypothetical protein
MAMSVPTYDNAQVQEAALPGVRESSVVSPALLGARADRQIAEGTALMGAGDVLNAAAIKMKHEEDLRTVQTATAQYQEAAQNFTMDAKDKRTGAAAQGVVIDFDKFHTDTISKLMDGLKNPEQKQAFAVMAGRARLATRHDLGTFELSENRKAGDDSFNAVAKNTINAGAIASTDASAMAQRDILLSNTKAYAATRNMDAPTQEALVSKVMTDFHAQRIQQIVQSDPMAAQAYFDAHKDEIAGAQQAEIGGFAKKATATAQGTTSAQAAWDSLGPKSSTEPVKVFDMEERIRKELKGNEPAIEAGLKSIRERDSAFKNQRVEDSHALEASVNKLVLGGASSQQLRASPEFLSLSEKNPQAARNIDQFVENKAYTAIARAAASESRADAAEARAERQKQRAGMGAYLQYSNPDVLAKMSDDQVINLLPTLGNELTHHLMEKKQALTKNGDKVVEARIDQQDFDHVAQEIGLRPFDTKKNEDEKAQLGELKYAVEQRIDAEQRAQKRQLTREEKMKLVRQTVDDKVMQHNMIFPDKQVPAALLPKDAQGDAYVNVEGQKVKLSTIPADFRAQAITTRRTAGLSTSEETLAKLWLKNQAKK